MSAMNRHGVGQSPAGTADLLAPLGGCGCPSNGGISWITRKVKTSKSAARKRRLTIFDLDCFFIIYLPDEFRVSLVYTRNKWRSSRIIRNRGLRELRAQGCHSATGRIRRANPFV